MCLEGGGWLREQRRIKSIKSLPDMGEFTRQLPIIYRVEEQLKNSERVRIW